MERSGSSQRRSREWRAVRSVLVALAVAAVPFASDASEPDGRDVQSVLDCMAGNLPAESSSQHFSFESQGETGGGRSVDGRITWKRFADGKPRALLRVHAPADLKGAGLLLIEKQNQSDMFVYLPDLDKVRRINSRTVSGRIFGSDFTYEDFRQLQGMADTGKRERLPDSELDGVPVHVLANYPTPESGSAYERVVSYVEKERCIPLKSEMYEPGGGSRRCSPSTARACSRAVTSASRPTC